MARFVDQFFTQITGPSQNASDRESPKLVLLHGVMGYALNWRRVAKHFEDRFQVLAYDSRGHGRSVHADLSVSPDAASPEALAEDLRRILDDLGWKKIDLIGHSMGGRVAYTFAATYPERVEALVIEDIGPNMSAVTASTATRVLDRVPVPFVTKKAAKEWFETQFPIIFKDTPGASALGPWLYANMTEDEQGRGVWRFQVEMIRGAVESGRTQDRWDEIEQLACPTLVVRGERSTELPREVYQKMLKVGGRVGGGQMEGVEITDAGHWVHSEQTEAFNSAVDRFLMKHNAWR
ncbi:alpha/beta hydrolase [soil metagenome]